MKSRTIQSIEAGKNVCFTESIIVKGDVGENAVLKVEGNLNIEGKVNPGATVTASGNIKINIACPGTIITSENGPILIRLSNDQVTTKVQRSYGSKAASILGTPPSVTIEKNKKLSG